jgi:hypothetical protein
MSSAPLKTIEVDRMDMVKVTYRSTGKWTSFNKPFQGARAQQKIEG